MSSTYKTLLLAFLVIICILLPSCASGPPQIQAGSPAFFWSTAKQAYQSGDYVRASENLSKLTQSDNEYHARAEAWLMVLSSGLAQGYMDVADAYDAGGRMNPDNRIPFRKAATAARSAAKSMTLQTAEAIHHFRSHAKDQVLPVEFGYPTGSLAENGTLAKIAKGMPAGTADAEFAERTALQKGVVMVVCRVVGAEDDSAKAAEVFKQTPLQVPRATFLLGVAKSLHEEARLFSIKQLDEPMRVKMLCNEATEALKDVPDSKEKKTLETKIEKTVKELRAT